jgi:acyl dehydratase
MSFYYEDGVIGQKFSAGPLTVTEDDIIRYAKEFDPQFFHTDPVAAKSSLFGGLVASGWHTASVMMRLIVKSTPPMDGGVIGRSVEKMNWVKPVRPGDALSYEAEILETSVSASQPDRGIFKMHGRVTNQNGDTVLEATSVVFVPRRKL